MPASLLPGDMTVGKVRALCAEDDDYFDALACLVDLEADVVSRRLETANGRTLLRNAFKDVWPSRQDEIAPLTVRQAREDEVRDHIATITGLDRGAVTRRLNAASDRTRVFTVFSDKWPLPDDEEADADAEGGIDYCSDAYGRELLRELRYSPEAAALPLYDYQERAVAAVARALDPLQPKILHLGTGGGKTRVANTIVARWIAERGAPVLWVTKDWRLLRQAAGDYSRRQQLARLSRLGGNGHMLHPLPDGGGGDVVYTTIQTLSRRLELGAIEAVCPTLVVWDECHWGEGGRVGRALTAFKRAGIPVLGLTATPREVSKYVVAYSKTFYELVDEGFLARADVQPAIPTGVHWAPQFHGAFKDVNRASLDELGRDQTRNQCIVDNYVKNAGKYGKTIVFACNIDHVNRLARMFVAHGVAAGAMHSQLDEGQNQNAIEAFRCGAVKVLVNMEMLTHGVDIPDVRTVFLCRPTTSDILFAQMVGRAARRDRASGKTSFYVVEFTDNVLEHGDLFETAQRFFTGSGLSADAAPSMGDSSATNHRTREHAFDPEGAPTWIPNDAAVPESLQGLWYRQGQTFGIEFELTRAGDAPVPGDPEWLRVAEAIRLHVTTATMAVAPGVLTTYVGSEGDKDTSVWNVEHDASVGWEVTSPILWNEDGFTEVDSVCRALEQAAGSLGLHLSARTGTHIHLGWRGASADELIRAIRLVRLFEPALATLVAPSRIASFNGSRYDTREPNEYCRPISSVFGLQALRRLRTKEDVMAHVQDPETRYVTFNVRPLASIGTVEVRLHSGTVEARKILLWVSLWQQLLWAATYWPVVPDIDDAVVLTPRWDIIDLARTWLPPATQAEQARLLERLAERRAEVVEHWGQHPDLAPWLACASQWQA